MRSAISLLGAMVAASALLMAGACDSEAAGGAEILPHLSPVNFGDLYPLGNRQPEPTSNERVPYEWVLLLQNGGSESLRISKVCLLDDNHNGVAGDKAFSIRVSDALPLTVVPGSEAAVEITFEHEELNVDLDGDTEADPDTVALVVESNAKNYPTLVIPVCARLVENGTEKGAFECFLEEGGAIGETAGVSCP